MEGAPPDPCGTAPGCPFHDRCPHRVDRCAVESPVLSPLSPEHEVACWQPLPPVRFRGRRETEEAQQ
ncbi:oligopeptide/dipeptide ABC transporter ATP-binding protein [Streptomyces sp. NPDC002328]|uniref:oligopeptide/dipeptide ABC transporter ATP-binding protein n=1 Tax=Streptomyces sp. NPDC002328 TaxID=3364642 RepID=UPI0036A27368